MDDIPGIPVGVPSHWFTNVHVEDINAACKVAEQIGGAVMASTSFPVDRGWRAAKLARGKTGRLLAALVGLLTVIEGLPLAYSKYLQGDKELVFDAADTPALAAAATAAWKLAGHYPASSSRWPYLEPSSIWQA